MRPRVNTSHVLGVIRRMEQIWRMRFCFDLYCPSLQFSSTFDFLGDPGEVIFHLLPVFR